MRRLWILGGVGGMLLVSTLLARPGIVRTRDGQTVIGDVKEEPDQVTVESRGLFHMTIDRNNIRSITYSDTIEQETRKRLAKLTAYDVAGRVELSHWLFDNKAYDLALTVLDGAAKIEPHNPDMLAMTLTVRRQMILEQSEARKHEPVQLAAADNRPPTGVAPAAGAPAAAPAGSKRLLTAEEINEIKQAEWLDGQTQVRVTFKNDVRRKYVAKQGIDPTQFNRQPPAVQAWQILQNGTSDMKKDVIVASDPPALAAYKRVQQSLINTGCMNCHSGAKAQGKFALHFPDDGEPATYTNFLILTQYQATIGEKQYLMINRGTPDDSLLLQFALPMDIAQPPHPKTLNFRGAVQRKADPRFKAAEDWVNALKQPAPDYTDIDLTASKENERPLAPRPTTRPAAGTSR